MKIAVAGTGSVGLFIATLLAQDNEVIAVDIVAEKVNLKKYCAYSCVENSKTRY